MGIDRVLEAGLVSVIAGLLGSLLGLGGGLFVTPMLTGPLGVSIHRAVAASIIAVIATSSAGSTGYLKRNLPNVRLGMLLEAGTVIGAMAGTLVGTSLSARVLSGIFAVLLVGTGVSLARRPAEHAVTPDLLANRLGLSADYPVAHVWAGLALAVFAGIISGLLGVGGGLILVPAMVVLMGVPIKVATATSTFMIGITGVASAVIQLSRGAVDPVLAAPVVLGIFIGATLGPRVSPLISSRLLQMMFLLAIGLSTVEMVGKAVA